MGSARVQFPKSADDKIVVAKSIVQVVVAVGMARASRGLQVLMRGDPEELNGFCRALTDIVASSDEGGDSCRMIGDMAESRCGPA